jgi:hypothetical protein
MARTTWRDQTPLARLLTRGAAQVSLLALLLSLAAIGGCKKGAANLCASDVQCGAGFACDPATGRCGCSSDSSCAEGESCNAAGFCQPRLRCNSTADCALGTYCDSQSGRCIAQGSCTQDVQCPPAQVCDQTFSCVPGCNRTGDCHLSEVCRACPAGTPVAQCPVGSLCVQGQCDSQLSCPYGSICAPAADNPDGGAVCQKDTRGPFCEPCTSTPGSPYSCGLGQAEDYCLIDASQVLGQAFFCGVNCAEGEECPNGYQCRDVRIVTAQNCDADAGFTACTPPSTNPPCDPAKTHPAPGGIGDVNDDCEAVQPPLVGSVCDPDTKRCAAQCLGTGEAGVQAFCSCIADKDCPQDVCTSNRVCSISGKPCFLSDNPDDCQSTEQIFCVKETDARLGDVGYCRIGQNCAPAPGFTCAILRAGAQ